jgi:signal recognition particle receptor subunit beta
VLQGVDGIAFVADAAPLRMAENMTSLAELESLLGGQGKRLAAFPFVLECNKSDLPGALPPGEMLAALGLVGAIAVRASAIHGEGVFDALRAVSKQVAASL